MVIIASIIPIVGSLASQVLSVIFLVGYFVVCRNIKIGHHVLFEHFFKGFSSIGQITIIQLILLGFSLVILLPLIIYGFTVFFSGLITLSSQSNYAPKNPLEILELFNADGIIPLIIITFLVLMFMQTIYSFAVVNAHFFKAQAWQSLEASRKVIQKKFFHFFGLIIIIMLINILGILCLLVGLLVTVPLSYTIMYSAFDDIMQPDSENLVLEGNSTENRSL